MTSGVSEVKDVEMDVSVTQKRRRRRRTRKMLGDDTVVEKDTNEESKVQAKPEIKVHAKPEIKLQPKPETKATQVILAPAKPKVLLVPKGIKKPAELKRKTFKARRLSVVIDNTAKTQKQRRKVLADIDSMNEDTLRAAAVTAKLSRAETVAKVPIPLLRQLMKDYRMMRGMLV